MISNLFIFLAKLGGLFSNSTHTPVEREGLVLIKALVHSRDRKEASVAFTPLLQYMQNRRVQIPHDGRCCCGWLNIDNDHPSYTYVELGPDMISVDTAPGRLWLTAEEGRALFMATIANVPGMVGFKEKFIEGDIV